MKIAVVGAGIAGLTAAYHLHRRCELTVFEADAHLGGHTYTVPLREAGRELALDMGFIVYNERTYPHFTGLLAELGVATEASSMSFSVRSERTGLEYCGSSLRQLFVQKRNLLSPSFHRMLLAILRFHRRALTLLDADPGLSLGDWLAAERYPRVFVEHYLLPMTSAIWSTPARSMLDFPARTLAHFLHNHGMLTVDERPVWRVVSGGSQRYVERLVAGFRSSIRAHCAVRQVRRLPDGVELRLEDGQAMRCDAVVVACHSDQALRLLADPTPAEAEVLGALPYVDNDAVLHTDRRFLPRHRAAWSSWNYHLHTPTTDATQLTYYMNALQNLPGERPYCVTLNRGDEIDPATMLHRARFAHPQFTTAGLAAQGRWPEISGDRTVYAGAYWFHGFHEDGVRSGLRAAEAVVSLAARQSGQRTLKEACA